MFTKNKLATLIRPILAGSGSVILEYTYPSAEQIPQGFEGLYTEREGVFHLTGVRGLKTQTDINTIMGSLDKERNDHKETKAKFAQFGDKDPTDILAKLDRIEELELAAGGKLDDETINKMVESRLSARLNPIQRELDQANTQVKDLTGRVTGYEQSNKDRKVKDALASAARELKVEDSAFDDAMIIGAMYMQVSEDGRVVTSDKAGVAGLDPKVWLTEQQRSRPHWWPQSKGAGAKGGKGGAGDDNPFSKDSWNMTKQGQLHREDPELAKQLAAAAGTTVGGRKPE